jgi:cytochrome c553
MKHFLILCAALVTVPAQAGKYGLPADMPTSYKDECGSCHSPFPPALLGASDWKQTLANLEKHFGTDASLDAKTTGEIGAWLARHASSRLPASGSEPRLTQTTWFLRKHDEVPAKIWKDSRIKRAANCAACHPRADQGRYGEHEIKVPGLGRWEDH